MYYCIGLDISKKLIAVHIPLTKQDIEIENNIKSIKALYSKLKKLYKKDINNLVFIFEPTGSYSFTLKKFCFEKNIKAFLINPKQFSNHSKALGERNKTDIIDAQILSKSLHLAKEEDIKVPHINKDAELIKELIGYYKFLTKQRVKTQNHLEAIKAKDGNTYTIKELEKNIKELKKKEANSLLKIKEVINSNKSLIQSFSNIKTLSGIGEIGDIVLLHLFIKYPKANQRQITALAGLDPIFKQSGSSINKREKISKAGSKLYRGSLFMGVMTAIRYDENFKYFFERLKSNGKHTTLAQIAVMRKLVIIAHSLFKNNQQYNSEIYKKALGCS